MRSSRWNSGEVTSVEAEGLSFWDERRAQGVLASCTHVHGEQVVDCLHFESCLVEFALSCRNILDAACGGVHGGPSTQLHGAVSDDMEVCAQALLCWFGIVQESRWDGAGARGCPYLNLGGVQLEVCGAGGARRQVDGGWDVLGLDPDEPVVHSAVEGAMGF